MKKLFWQFSILVLGLAAFGLYMRISGPSRPNTETFTQIPTIAWEGGEKSVKIHTEVNEPSKLLVHLIHHKPNGKPGREIVAKQELAAGAQEFLIKVPPKTEAYFQLDLATPKPGVTMNWQVDYAEKKIHQYSGINVTDSVDFPDITADDPKKSVL